MPTAAITTLGPARPNQAKIVATLGPASQSAEIVAKLIEAGVSVFRLNLSHGTFADHAARLATVRQVAGAAGATVAVLADLPGPKIRVGSVPDLDGSGGVALAPGQEVVIDPAAAVATLAGGSAGGGGGGAVVLGCTYAEIGRDIEPGQRLLINDGAIRTLVISKEGTGAVRCRVTTGGVVTSGKGINLPDTELSIPAITERDEACVEWAVGAGVDFLALSFVRSATEVEALRDLVAGMCSRDRTAGDAAGEHAGRIPIVAKIEKPQAVVNMESIVRAADAIMVARGDLGVEMDIAQVPVVQKRLVAAADSWGKPCIVATQMLESMILAPGPTRAEASDVANAVFDGADALMLSAETAAGRYPVLAVETMARIIRAAESRMDESGAAVAQPSPPRQAVQSGYPTAALAHGAWDVAHGVRARLVVCWSQEGGAARYLSQTGFRIPIIACSSSVVQTRRMALLRGVCPLLMELPPGGGTLAEWNARVDAELIARGWAREGDAIVLVAGRPLGVKGATNALATHYVGNPMTGFRAHGA